MKLATKIGVRKQYKAKKGFLLYENVLAENTGSRDAFMTVHDVFPAEIGSERCAQLGAGQLVTEEFIGNLARGLERTIRPEILPECVLAHNRHITMWWVPREQRAMFFSAGAEDRAAINGKVFPHPALLVVVLDRGNQMYLRALGENQRPAADTPTYVAPYWNTEPHSGLVCLGDTLIPKDKSGFEQLPQWVTGYFSSRFTHPSGSGVLTTHPGGFIGLWTDLAGKSEFPTRYLYPTKTETVQKVLEHGTKNS